MSPDNFMTGTSSKIAYAIVPKEKPEIISHFLMNHYHQQEPITVALGMLTHALPN